MVMERSRSVVSSSDSADPARDAAFHAAMLAPPPMPEHTAAYSQPNDSLNNSRDDRDPVDDAEFQAFLKTAVSIPDAKLIEEELEEGELESFIPKPPDGGYGWVIVFASFMANFLVDGASYSFGMFMPELQRHFRASKGQCAFVGSLSIGVCLLIGPLASALVNQFGSKSIMIVGGVFSCTGYLLSAYVTSIAGLMACYGVIGGIGMGLVFLPSIVHVGIYFEEKRALATGIAVAGSGIGTVVFAPLTVVLIQALGWQGAILVLAGFMLNCCVFGSLLRELKPLRDPKRMQQQIDDELERLELGDPERKLSDTSFMSLDATTMRTLRKSAKLSNNSSLYANLSKKSSRSSRSSHHSSRSASRSGSTATMPFESSVSKASALLAVPETQSIHPTTEDRERSVGLPMVPEFMDTGKGDGDGQPLVIHSAPVSRLHSKASSSTRSSSSTFTGLRWLGLGRKQSALDEEGGEGGEGLQKASVGSEATPTISSSRRHSRSPGLQRPAQGRITAEAYGKSLTRLHQLPVPVAAANLRTLGNIKSGDFSRPLYRRDIFYAGSVRNLKKMKAVQGDMSRYLQSTISIPPGVKLCEEVDVNGVKAVLSLYDSDDSDNEGMCYFLPPSIRNVLFDMMGLDLLRNPVMLLLCLCNIISMLGFYCPFVFLASKAMDEAGVSGAAAALLLSVLGGANTVGRVFFGWLSDHPAVPVLAVHNACLGCCAALTLLVPFFDSYVALIVYAGLFGFLSSTLISLSSIILVDYLGLENLSNAFGLLILSRGVPAMVGAPLAGMVYDYSGSYDASFLYSGGMLTAACVVGSIIHFLPMQADDEDEDGDGDGGADDSDAEGPDDDHDM